NAAPAMATTKRSASSSGETRGFGLVNEVRGRAVVGCAFVAGIDSVEVSGLCAVGVEVLTVGETPLTFCCGTPPASVAGIDIDDIVSRLKARSRADWKRRSRSFSRQRRTRRSSDGGMFGSRSARSGGSSLRIALSVSIDELRLN